jgi:DNA-binding transcriptional regulator YdaS (Cro superfamily)
MELRDYLHVKRLKVNEFARIIRFDRNYVSSMKYGKLKPGEKFIRSVEEATQGEVSEKDLLQTYYNYQKTKPCTCCEQSHMIQTD